MKDVLLTIWAVAVVVAVLLLMGFVVEIFIIKEKPPVKPNYEIHNLSTGEIEGNAETIVISEHYFLKTKEGLVHHPDCITD